MKKLFCLGLLTLLLSSVFSLSVFAKIEVDLPSTSSYLNDFAGVVNTQDQEIINTLAQELDSKTTAQISVVSVNTTKPETIEQYAVRLFKKWGIGQKGKDNGVLFLIASADHKVRIEVGYGLEGVLTDAICSRIINEIVVPKFKQGEMSKGVLEGTQAIVSLVAKEYGAAITGQEADVYNRLHQDTSGVWVIIFVFILIFVFYTFSFKRPGVGWYGYYGGSGGGFGGGSGSSGGFGGFGGGGSGGGGSSGSW